MSHLTIRYGTGEEQLVELSKQQPVSIGSHPSNDVRIADDGVATMHCRVSWNKTAFEAVAAGGDGIEVNGTRVHKAVLKPGDLLRVGSADIVFAEQPRKSLIPGIRPPADEEEVSTFGLRPLSDEIEIPLPKPVPAVPESKPRKPDRNAPPVTAEELLVEDPDERRERKRSRSSDREPEEGRSRSKERESEADRARRKEREAARSRPERTPDKKPKEDRPPGPSRPAATPPRAPATEAKPAGDARMPEEAPAGKFISRSVEMAAFDAVSDKAPIEAKDKLSVRLREHLHSQKRRPGERDALRSPLVLMLGGGAALLVLVGLTFHLITSRQTTQARFDDARLQMEEGKYTQAIRDFENFIAVHPRDPHTDDAQVLLGLSRIERSISGATPDWSNGIKELRDFITVRRDVPGFEDLHDEIRERSQQIAEGAATTAGKTFDRNLLAISDEARALLTTYAPKDVPPTEVLNRIEAFRRTSEAAILKHETLTGAVDRIDASLAAKKPLAAIVTRRELINRYREFETHRTIQDRLQKTLETEQQLVRSENPDIPAVTDERPAALPQPLSLVFHARSRSDEVSIGRMVLVLAADCCYGVDSVTGLPLWRRVVGWDTPFFPVQIQTPLAGVVVFDTVQEELLLLEPMTGKLLWRQLEAGRVVDRPIVDQGQLYVVNDRGELNKLELDSGQLSARLTFSQPVSSLAALNDDKRLVVAGNEEVLYTLTKRPLECVAVSYTGHKPESIAAPMLPMGALVMLAENQPADESQLRVFDTRAPSNLLEQIAQDTIPGHVLDEPAIRGRDVFVPSSGERASAFSVSDDRDQPPFTTGPRFAAQGGGNAPVFLKCGPDGQLWMASRTLRKLQLTTDTLQPDQRFIELGMASQPLQDIGNWLYVGSHPAYSSAATLTQTDRDELSSQWQMTAGARVLEFTGLADQGGLVALTDAGNVFRITPAQLEAGGFQTTPTARLSLPGELTTPLIGAALGDSQIAVACGAPQPQVWIVNRLGQADRPVALPQPLEAPPIRLADRLLLPLSGRLHLLRANSGQTAVQDLALPQGAAETPAWRQVIAVDDVTAIALTQAGELILVNYQTSPQPFLGESGRLSLDAPIDFRGDLSGDRLAVAANRRFWLIDAASLDPRAEQALPNPVSNDLWFAGELLLVETGGTELHAFRVSPELQRVWTLPLSESLAGRPLDESGQLALALQDGTLLSVNRDTGALGQRLSVGQAVTSGVRRIGKELVVATMDGSLVRATALMEAK